jgi:hypothetical protein
MTCREQPQNNKMQRTKHCSDGASPLILVLGGRWYGQRSMPGLMTAYRAWRNVLLALCVAVGTEACALLPRSHDYILSVTCIVLDPAGQPVSDAEVVLELGHVAYHAVDPIREERKATPASGGVIFMYITHAVSTPYVLTVRKLGYTDGQVSGVAASGKQGTHLQVTLMSSTLHASDR